MVWHPSPTFSFKWKDLVISSPPPLLTRPLQTSPREKAAQKLFPVLINHFEDLKKETANIVISLPRVMVWCGMTSICYFLFQMKIPCCQQCTGISHSTSTSPNQTYPGKIYFLCWLCMSKTSSVRYGSIWYGMTSISYFPFWMKKPCSLHSQEFPLHPTPLTLPSSPKE